MRGFLTTIFILIAGLAHSQDQQPFATFLMASEPVLNDPHDLAIGPDGQIYIADKFGNRIVVMDPETLEVTGSFGDGQLLGVHDISFGPDGKAYVAVTGLSAVAVYDLSGAEPALENVIRGFPRTEGALAHSNGRIYVMSSGDGDLIGVEGDKVVAGARGMLGAHDVAEAPDGTIWLADTAARRLVHLTEDLKLIKILDDPSFGFVGPRYLDIDPAGRLIVADQDAHSIFLIDPETETLLGVLGDGLPGIGENKFDDPEGALFSGGSFYFSDSDNNRIVRYVVLLN